LGFESSLCFNGASGPHLSRTVRGKEGIIMLLVTMLTLGFGAAVTGLLGLIEGIIYLTKTDEDFVKIYVQAKKAWF
jgi:hypothetical protein